MTAFCCDHCPLEPSCADVLEATFARLDDVTDDEPNIVRGEE